MCQEVCVFLVRSKCSCPLLQCEGADGEGLPPQALLMNPAALKESLAAKKTVRLGKKDGEFWYECGVYAHSFCLPRKARMEVEKARARGAGEEALRGLAHVVYESRSSAISVPCHSFCCDGCRQENDFKAAQGLRFDQSVKRLRMAPFNPSLPRGAGAGAGTAPSWREVWAGMDPSFGPT